MNISEIVNISYLLNIQHLILENEKKFHCNRIIPIKRPWNINKQGFITLKKENNAPIKKKEILDVEEKYKLV